MAEPRATVWDVDFAEAAAFGGTVDGGSGLTGPAPPAGATVINQDLATALEARAGDALTFYLYGRATTFRVARIVPTMGIAGAGTGAITREAFFAPGTLAEAAMATGGARQPQTFTFVSNTGGVEAGSDTRTGSPPRSPGPSDPWRRAARPSRLPRRRCSTSAEEAGNALGSMFLFIGSFSIIAGILLLVNIFVMLAEERKPELGMLRAIGMKRSRLVRSFMIEGSIYALAASVIGVVLGIGVGRAVVLVAARIFRSGGDNSFDMTFKFTWTSLVNGFALGFLISFVTVTLTSIRISRVNIVAAIRDLTVEGTGLLRRRWVVLASIAAAFFGAESAMAISRNQGVGTYLYPALTILALCPLLVRVAPKRWVYTGAAVAVMAWSLLANTVRPHILDSGSTAVYVILGVLLTFTAVFLVSENQRQITRPLSPLISRPTERGLAGRLAVAYPTARRFRTGAILIMYGLVVFTLVIIMILGRLIDSTVDATVRDASGGFPIRVDYNASNPVENPASAFTTGRFAGKVQTVIPLRVTHGRASMPGGFQEVDAVVVGVGPAIVHSGFYPLSDRLPATQSDRAAWELMLNDPRYVIVDQFLGQAGGGPPAVTYTAGQRFSLLDPATGSAQEKTIAGILRASDGLRGIQNSGFTSPILMSWDAARAQFGDQAKLASALIKPDAGVSVRGLAADLQAEFLTNGLRATQVRRRWSGAMSGTRGFFQLMQGFLALGLLIGIAGTGHRHDPGRAGAAAHDRCAPRPRLRVEDGAAGLPGGELVRGPGGHPAGHRPRGHHQLPAVHALPELQGHGDRVPRAVDRPGGGGRADGDRFGVRHHMAGTDRPRGSGRRSRCGSPTEERMRAAGPPGSRARGHETRRSVPSCPGPLKMKLLSSALPRKRGWEATPGPAISGDAGDRPLHAARCQRRIGTTPDRLRTILATTYAANDSVAMKKLVGYGFHSESRMPPSVEPSAMATLHTIASTGRAVNWTAEAAGVITRVRTSRTPTTWMASAVARATRTSSRTESVRRETPLASAPSGSTLANSRGR